MRTAAVLVTIMISLHLLKQWKAPIRVILELIVQPIQGGLTNLTRTRSLFQPIQPFLTVGSMCRLERTVMGEPVHIGSLTIHHSTLVMEHFQIHQFRCLIMN